MQEVRFLDPTIYQQAPEGNGFISPCKRFFWINIPKCASTSISHELTYLGWVPANYFYDKLPENIHYFAVIRDPIDRWYSGICEYIWKRHRCEFSNVPFAKYVKTALNDFTVKLIFDAITVDLHTTHQSYYLNKIDVSKATLFKFDNSLRNMLALWFTENQLTNSWITSEKRHKANDEKIYLRETLHQITNHRPEYHQRVIDWFSLKLVCTQP